MDFGKLPPQSRELEQAVLCAVMIDKDAMDQVASMLRPEIFYVDSHSRICRAIIALYVQGEPIDLLTVTEQLKKQGELDEAGGPFYVAQLTNMTGSSANVEYHCRIVFEKYIQRCLISSSTEVIKDAYEDTTDVFELFNRAEKQMRDTRSTFLIGSVSTIDAVLQKADEQKDSGFVPSKHNFINKAFGGGWGKGLMNIVAARPAMGKTAWKISELLNAVEEGYKCASINLEMMENQFVTRVICNKTNISNTRYRRKDWHEGDEEKIAVARKWLRSKEHNLSLVFSAPTTYHDVIGKLRKIKSDKGLDIAFIDHLQFISVPPEEAKGRSKDEQIGVITKALKGFAKDESVSLVVLCHLNRQTEALSTKRPSMSHLRESGNIEGDADTVSFLFRPEYYFDKDENGIPQYKTPEQSQYKNVCQFLCDKNRDGHVFEANMKCKLGVSNFYDIEDKDDSVF